MNAHNDAYRHVANANPDKFCHGFGIFQYDIQFCKTDPDYFLHTTWFDFSTCLKNAIKELDDAKARAMDRASPR